MPYNHPQVALERVCAQPRSGSRSGFTLVELLVVLAVLVVLGALAFPALNRALEVSRRGVCASNLRSLGQGVLAWSADNNGELPQLAADGLSAWPLTIGDYIGFKYQGWPTYQSWLDSGFKSPALPKILFCPSAKRTTAPVVPIFDICYGINLPLVGNWDYNPRTKLARVPSHSKVILLADSKCWDENGGGHGWSVANYPGQPFRQFSRRHGSGANICWLDGHVTFENLARLDELEAQPLPNGSSWNPRP